MSHRRFFPTKPTPKNNQELQATTAIAGASSASRGKSQSQSTSHPNSTSRSHSQPNSNNKSKNKNTDSQSKTQPPARLVGLRERNDSKASSKRAAPTIRSSLRNQQQVFKDAAPPKSASDVEGTPASDHNNSNSKRPIVAVATGSRNKQRIEEPAPKERTPPLPDSPDSSRHQSSPLFEGHFLKLIKLSRNFADDNDDENLEQNNNTNDFGGDVGGGGEGDDDGLGGDDDFGGAVGGGGDGDDDEGLGGDVGGGGDDDFGGAVGGGGEGDDDDDEGNNTNNTNNSHNNHNNRQRISSQLPDLPRNHVPIHLSGSRLQTFNEFTWRAELDDHHAAMGRRLCNAATTEERFMATMALGLSNRQHMTAIHNDLTSQISELRDHAANSAADSAVKAPWLNKEDAAELRSCLRNTAFKQIHRGDIQAYTATADKTGQKNKLPACLHAAVMNAILANPTPWKKRLLPPGYGKNPKQPHTKAFSSLVNVVLKEVRKEFEGSLLENIHLPNRAGPTDEAVVPTIESLYVTLKEKEAESRGGRVVVREDIVANFKHQEEARLAYLRMQACHWGFYKSEYSDKTFWCVVDDQLEILQKQSRRYRYAFAIICLAEDYDLFKGKKTLAELRPLTSFPVPNDEWIRKVMSELDETWGDDVPELEALHE